MKVDAAGKKMWLGALPVLVTKKSKFRTSLVEILPPLVSIIPAGTLVIPAISATVTSTVLEVVVRGGVPGGLFGSS